MNKLLLSAAFLLLSLPSMADKLELAISNLNCGNCVETLKRALAPQLAITDVVADVRAKKVVIVYNEEQISEQIIKLLVTEAGFQIDEPSKKKDKAAKKAKSSKKAKQDDCGNCEKGGCDKQQDDCCKKSAGCDKQKAGGCDKKSAVCDKQKVGGCDKKSAGCDKQKAGGCDKK